MKHFRTGLWALILILTAVRAGLVLASRARQKKAKEINADLIVLGTCGMEVDLNRLFFGSTAEKVVRMLPCPVLCVPPPEF